jgi:hypothetical protein
MRIGQLSSGEAPNQPYGQQNGYKQQEDNREYGFRMLGGFGFDPAIAAPMSGFLAHRGIVAREGSNPNGFLVVPDSC